MNKNKELKDYIRLHYSTQSTEYIANKFNTTTNNIRQIARRIGVNKRFANDIIDNHKLCSTCNKLLPIDSFYKDKYQRNNLRYECIECFNVGNNKNNKEFDYSPAPTPKSLYCINDRKPNINYCNNDSIEALDRKHNPIIYRGGVAGLKCKVCNEWKPLSEFYKNKKMESGHLNSCKVCEKERRKSRGI